MKVRWTKPALDRLKARKVWLESLEYANPRKIIAAIRNSVKSLERLGDIGRPSSVIGHRKLSVRLVPYVIIYRNEGELCVIATVYHTAKGQKISASAQSQRQPQALAQPTSQRPQALAQLQH